MKVETKEKHWTFGSVREGETFLYGGELHIRTDRWVSENVQLNAARLSDGKLRSLDHHFEVHRVAYKAVPCD